MVNKKLYANVIAILPTYDVKTNAKDLAAKNIKKTNIYVITFTYAIITYKKQDYQDYKAKQHSTNCYINEK